MVPTLHMVAQTGRSSHGLGFVSWETYVLRSYLWRRVQSIPLIGTSILLFTKKPKSTPNEGEEGEREATFLSLVPCWPSDQGAR